MVLVFCLSAGSFSVAHASSQPNLQLQIQPASCSDDTLHNGSTQVNQLSPEGCEQFISDTPSEQAAALAPEQGEDQEQREDAELVTQQGSSSSNPVPSHAMPLPAKDGSTSLWNDEIVAVGVFVATTITALVTLFAAAPQSFLVISLRQLGSWLLRLLQ